jgi:hypothetical protein
MTIINVLIVISIITAIAPKIISKALKRYEKDVIITNQIKARCFLSLFLLFSRKVISLLSEEMAKSKSMDFAICLFSIITLLIAFLYVWSWISSIKSDMNGEQE